MNISWDNIDNLKDYLITYLLYRESKSVSQISKIRNLSIEEVNEHLIKAKFEMKALIKEEQENSKDILDKYLELGKDDRLIFVSELDEDNLLDFKRKLYKRILQEKNAEDLIVLLWTVGELNDERFLKLLHSMTSHRHSDVRRITYSALRKICSSSSIQYFHKGLYDSNAQTRQYCAKALGNVGNSISIEILKKLLNEKRNEKNYVINAYLDTINKLENSTKIPHT